MARIVCLIYFIIVSLHSYAQNMSGITYVADSSYTIASEFKKHRKNYPKLGLPLNEVNAKKPGQVLYKKVNGANLYMDVYQPGAGIRKNHIPFIFVHGGGWRSGNKSMHAVFAQRLAALGYTCFLPQYRLSTEALYPAAVLDVGDAIRYVKKNAKRFKVDTAMLTIAGHSAGGQIAALFGTNNLPHNLQQTVYLGINASVAALINIDGTLSFIHPESGEGADQPGKPSAATLWFGYTKAENPALWQQASPLTYLAKAHAPALFLNSSVVRMHAGRDDATAVLNSFRIPNEVYTFRGSPHSFILFEPWLDSAVARVDTFLKRIFPPQKMIVAKDGTGNFKTVTAAIAAVPLHNKRSITIHLEPGSYFEKIYIDSLQPHITLIGEDANTTLITYNDHTGKISASGNTIDTRTSYTIKIDADNFTARNLSFVNDAGFTAGQAVALEINGDKAVFDRCRFTGFQDVLFPNREQSRQYFYKCYIEGTTDFIFGASTAWFEKCTIYSKKNSHITAASTPQHQAFGYIFNACKIYADDTLRSVSLGRPWRPYASVIFMNTYLPAQLRPEGWSNWNNTNHYKTARYSEYKNYGPGFIPSARLPWARQISNAEAANITPKIVFKGWQPKIK